MLEAGYNTVEGLINEGCTIDDENEAMVARAKVAGIQAANYIENMTKRSFLQVPMTVMLDYKPGQMTFFMPLPIISISQITLNDNFVGNTPFVIPVGSYTVYNRIWPDDRKDPKIMLVSGWGGRNPDRSPWRTLDYGAGKQTVQQGAQFTGVFGYQDTDANGNLITPYPIISAHAKLVERLLPTPVDSMSAERRVRERVTNESDGRFKSYSLQSIIRTSMITGDQEIDEILSMYRAPLAMGSA